MSIIAPSILSANFAAFRRYYKTWKRRARIGFISMSWMAILCRR